MHYPKNLTSPPHHPHELARRQAKCQERLRHHTTLAIFHGLIGFACLGLLFNYIQKDFPHKKSVLIPLTVVYKKAQAKRQYLRIVWKGDYVALFRNVGFLEVAVLSERKAKKMIEEEC